jgi:RNA polymerase sigma factor (sigma-70 family)
MTSPGRPRGAGQPDRQADSSGSTSSGGNASAGGPAGAVDFSRIAQDPTAFEVFYRRHVTAVTRFVARRAADPHTVADLTAEVFLAVIDSAHTYRPGRGTEVAWLYGVARNVIAGERRRVAQELRTAARVGGHRLLAEDDIARLEERIDAESSARGLYQALARLPEYERAVLELVAIDGLPVKEAATALGIRAGTARVRLHRARRSAREAFRQPVVVLMPADVRATSPETEENQA